MSRKIIAFLQARTDSNRLPRKVLKKILDKPMIIHQLERTKRSLYLDRLIVLTSDESSDDTLASTVTQYGFEIIRGDKNNVLKRYHKAMEQMVLEDDDVIVRLTGDCPLHDAGIIDETIEAFLACECDYLSNCISPVYPDGLDVEVFSAKSLKVAHTNAALHSEKEHVTPYIRNSGLFKIRELKKSPVYVHWRLTVDEEEDLVLIKSIYEYFGRTLFSFQEIVIFLEEHQELLSMNGGIHRNEGYAKSLEEDI